MGKEFENPQLMFEAEIGWRMRDKRRQRKMTQIAVAERLGIHRNQLMRWECGAAMSLWEFLRWCDILCIQHQTVLPAHEKHLGQMLREVKKERDGDLLRAIVAERDPPLAHRDARKLPQSIRAQASKDVAV